MIHNVAIKFQEAMFFISLLGMFAGIFLSFKSLKMNYLKGIYASIFMTVLFGIILILVFLGVFSF